MWNLRAHYWTGSGWKIAATVSGFASVQTDITSISEVYDVMYFAGSFTNVVAQNSIYANNLVAWYNNIVYPLGYGSDLRLEGLANYHDVLIVGGDAWSFDGYSYNNVAQFNPYIAQ